MTIPAGFAQITQLWTPNAGGRAAAIVWGVDHSGIMTALQIANAAQAAIYTTLNVSVSTGWGMESTLAKLGPDESGSSAYANGTHGVGETAGDGMTPNVTALITKNTGLGGRRGRGRIYLPGMVESSIGASGQLSGGFLTALQDDADNFLDALDAATIPMVLLHDPATTWTLVGGQPRRVPVAGAIPDPTPVTSLVVSPIAATQRRRLR